MKTRRSTKGISSVILGALLFSFHLCACQEVLAAVQTKTQTNETCGHHESDGGHSHDSNSEDKSSCCAKLIAVQNSTKLSNTFGDQTSSANYAKTLVPSASIVVDVPMVPRRQFEFPPGASPPGAFLAAHFTHAPPTIL